MAATSAMQSMPSFCYAILGIIFFAVQNRWFPVSGWTRLTDNPLENLKSVLMPSLSLALVEAAAYTRVLRTDVVTTLNDDFIMNARAKGLNDRRILLRHALRPSSFGLVTVAGVTLARLIGGTVVIEGLFEIPGLGNKIIRALGTRDYTMIQGIAAFLAIVYVFLSVAVEVIYALLDPRVRERVVAR
jgi:peptide/nickel transport system permease protein